MVALRNSLLLLLLREIGVAHAASLPVAVLPPPPPGTSDNGTHSLVEKREFTPQGIINFAQDWRVQLAITAATLRIGPFTWQGVARGCAEVSEQDALGKKVLKAVWDCGIGAVSGILVMLMGGISGIAAVSPAWGPLIEWLHATFSNHKRSLEDMDLHARDALPHLSTLLGVETLDNDTVTAAALRKRGDGELGLETRPVFGAKIFNRDFHFSIIDHSDVDDSLTWRFGFGMGGEGSSALEKRGPGDWFQGAGIDYKSLSPHGMGPIQGLDNFDKKIDLFAWVYYQLDCLLRVNSWDYPKSHTNGMYVQVYDDGSTRLAANFALYGADGQSGIGEMDWMDSIDRDEQCTIGQRPREDSPFIDIF